MARWECVVCGLIYDEAEGWPDDGIAPGTRWADVPEDWCCPDCGVGKSDFEMMPMDDAAAPAPATAPSSSATQPGSEDQSTAEAADTPQPAPSTDSDTADRVADATDNTIVIIGSGLAGYGLAREIRRHDTEAPITIVTADGGEVYSKPLLSTGFTKDLSVAKLAMQRADEIADQLKLTVLTRSQVVGIDRLGHRVALAGGRDLSYGKLVLAVGAKVIRPPMGGDALDDIFTVNDLDDYAGFQEAVASRGAKSVAIIGAGLIGSEFTNDLLNGGLKTHSVDPMGWCLPTLLPEACGKAVQSALEAKGAEFTFGALATRVDHDGEGYSVSLNNGDSLKADLVLSAVGVIPRTSLADAAGLKTGRGIVTDRYLRTSDPHIYAMGDCAEVAGHVLVYVAPLSAAARALGATLTGTETPVAYPAMPVSIKTPACPVTVCPPPRGADGAWTIEGEAPDLKATFHDPSGGLLGYALTGSAVREKGPLTRELPPVLE